LRVRLNCVSVTRACQYNLQCRRRVKLPLQTHPCPPSKPRPRHEVGEHASWHRIREIRADLGDLSSYVAYFEISISNVADCYGQRMRIFFASLFAFAGCELVNLSFLHRAGHVATCKNASTTDQGQTSFLCHTGHGFFLPITSSSSHCVVAYSASAV
jgi:hypothetical protein